MRKPINLAVLLSGSGRTLQNLMDLIEADELDARISVVISNVADAFGLERARKHGIPAVAAPPARIEAELARHPVDLVALAGYLVFFRIPKSLRGKVMNIHPALLPSFGGKGFYGRRVHEAVLEAGCKVTGCTVHFADDAYDRGPIIIQRTVPVLEEDTADTLAARVFEQELEAYPEAIQLFAEGRLRIEGRRVRILPAEVT